jgi:AraC family transcriptional regulator
MTMAFHPSGELHSEQFHSEPVRSFNVEVEPSWAERLREHSRLLESPMHIESGGLGSLALRMYREFRLMDDLSPLAVEALAIEVLVEASRQVRRPRLRGSREWLGHARELIHERFCETLTLAAIAKTVGVHPVHLATEFRKLHRCTIGQYLRRLRVEYACREISKSNTPLAQIALAAGFTDQSHLSRTFRQLTGMTPAAYRTASRPT